MGVMGYIKLLGRGMLGEVFDVQFQIKFFCRSIKKMGNIVVFYRQFFVINWLCDGLMVVQFNIF